ncbi:TnsD family Tn7-like transposition protein [Bacillus sp. SD088]|uniref:TnsD family Tn7-like transposition protein n=1 Tax=Bacillus sp. SD088 TaxID=2782012 RepID=UPI001A958905|nr:TnsD family Tn7-like transposition protein [Bacillus sp. SD088]MBO0992595.1 TnsD family transposase [Bacillus sp. SD088]
MLPFFTDPYPDELIYSTIARYHFYSGNIDYKDTLEEVFQSRSVIPSLEIGSHFDALAQQIGNYSVESLLSKHTIYPYYAPFLSKQRQQEILRDVQGDGKGLYTRLGMIAGGICKKDGLYYCPQCAKGDIDRYGEPYIHREHQLQGIDLCAHHYLQLKKYPDGFTEQSRIKFIRFEVQKMDLSVIQEVESPERFDIQVNLATMAYQLLNVDIAAFSREEIFKRYRMLLREKNLITTSNQVRQKELFDAFQANFPKGFLEKYESNFNGEDEHNWLKVLTRNEKRHVHPLRHLFFLYFLGKDVEELFRVSEDLGPFGKGPWPCLNKAADHYKQLVISNVKVTRDFKSTAPIGTFECSCGYIYARKGPDKSSEDKYHIGRVKVFGDTWMAKLRVLANKNLSIRVTAKMLGVDSKTVKKYLSLDEQKGKLESQDNSTMVQHHRQQLLAGIRQYSNDSRTQIRQRFQKEYIYLYRYDKEWLFNHLPINQTKVKPKATVDWEARDREYCSKIEKLYKELIMLDKSVRITISVIGKRLGILSNLEKHLDKLTRTKKLLNEMTETIQQFQIRRCCKIIDQMLQEEEPVILWKVQRKGAVKSHHFHEIKPHLEAYIDMKREVDNYGRTTS